MSNMNVYIGTKIINATPMDRATYVALRNWQLPEDEDGTDEGYFIEYAGSNPNHDDYKGYISWSPKGTFELSYKVTTGLSLGLAIDAAKLGFKIARSGWNGKNIYVYFVKGGTFTVNRAPLLGLFPEGHVITYRDHLDIIGSDGKASTWAPSNGDALATDWSIVK